MGKRQLPPGQRCRRIDITITDEDLEYARRLAREAKEAGRANASVSGQVRLALRDRRRVRHDLPGVAHVVEVTAELLERKELKPREAAPELRQTADRIKRMREEG